MGWRREFVPDSGRTKNETRRERFAEEACLVRVLDGDVASDLCNFHSRDSGFVERPEHQTGCRLAK